MTLRDSQSPGCHDVMRNYSSGASEVPWDDWVSSSVAAALYGRSVAAVR